MNKHQIKTKYLFIAGGLTGGPVMPLLAVAEEWQRHDKGIIPVIFDLKRSASRVIAQKRKLKFHRIITGKLRRYWTVKNVMMPFFVFIGLAQSFYFMRKYKPVAVLGAGGFVQLPLMFMAWIMRVPCFIHQQDVKATLSNQLCALFARLITTTFEFSIRDFLQGTGLGKKYITSNKVVWTGNPVLADAKPVDPEEARQKFGLSSDLPVLLVLGGASGAKGLNEKIKTALPLLTTVVQVVHSTGPGKGNIPSRHNYHPYEFISDMNSAYSCADVVLARAGIGTLSELAVYKKPSIIVPMPETHQEDNAALVYHASAGIAVAQEDLDAELIIRLIRKIIFSPDLQKKFGDNLSKLFPPKADEKIYHLIHEYISRH